MRGGPGVATEVLVVQPLLATKLHVPTRRRALVPRPRLSERLSRADGAALTLVSAPAGFGKTTVLTEWLDSGGTGAGAAAWLSLDEGDNDPAVFWTYVLAALRTVSDAIGADVGSSVDAVPTRLVNELAALPGELVLVLDDYHVVDSSEVRDGVQLLVEHLPAQVRLVIATRTDPVLPLARMRARGELVELRAADLRFTAEEAATYLGEVMGLDLTGDDVAALEARTEGWIAALQLAALSMQDRDDVAGFIANFAGDDRYIVDYLVEEVLQRQPEPVRSFLLQTSVLGRLTGPLCDAVTGRDDGAAVLDALDRGNLFVVPLDTRRRWYRYHHLFADVLQVHLLDEQPGAVADLHRRACAWHEREGDLAEAVAHALAAGDHDRAADLIEPALPALQRHRQEATMRRWLEALPDEVVRARPVLSVGYVAALMVSGDAAEVDERLREVERLLTADDAPAPGTVVVDEEAFRRLPAAIAVYRTGRLLLSGDVPGAIAHARTALDLLRPEDHQGRGAVAGLLGLAHWTTGDLDAGLRWWTEAAAALESAGFRSDVTGAALATADIRSAQGRPAEAMAAYDRALRIVDPGTGTPLRGAADLHVGMAGVLLERSDAAAARRHLAAADELGEAGGLPQFPYRRCVVLARVHEADGDVDGALALLAEAERRYVADYFPEVRPVAALRARLLARQGRWGEALGWARERGLSPADELDYLHEFAHLCLARALAARHAATGEQQALLDAVSLLDRLTAAAEAGGRTGSLIELLVVRAVAEQSRGDTGAAAAALRRAVDLGEPAGYVQVFLDERRSLAALLATVATPGGVLAAQVRRPTADVPGGPVDALSARELDVLRLLDTDLDGPDIARRLFVSVNTVRTHTKNIYAKLGVNNRRAAVRRGDELGLLGRAGER
ncbi:LuxR C-terminal-related transcriptional regulator [Pseudonocardia dioxanivorans]|uniref:LuxR C-terminal-related transcriptional regulator n=1 Tax=Pseudonocardia dioxanivorans TaxID=240495 RepID=UPI001F44AAB1|nr:LuxR C-terminal-related transcriptional regulator [Pseudonocardia dioxanivorans]